MECSHLLVGVNTPCLCDFIGEHGSACSLVGFALSFEAGGVHDFRKPVHSPVHALDQFFNRRLLLDYLFNFLSHHSAIAHTFASAHPSYASETPCSQCAARIETHTADNACNDEQAHN